MVLGNATAQEERGGNWLGGRESRSVGQKHSGWWEVALDCTTEWSLQHGVAEDSNVQGRSGTRLTAMRGRGREICGRGGQMWWMAECLEVVVADVWEEEVFVGREAYS